MISELSDRKPGFGTAFLVLLIFVLAGVVIVAGLFLYRKTNTYDADRAVKRYDTLKQLRTENAKKVSEYAILDQAKGVYQLPIKQASILTIKDLSTVRPHPAYPIVPPAPVESAAPGVKPDGLPTASPSPVSVTTPPVSAATP